MVKGEEKEGYVKKTLRFGVTVMHPTCLCQTKNLCIFQLLRVF